MKTWQWGSLMWILCMICYYVGDKQDIEPLIAAGSFALIGAVSLAIQGYEHGK